MKQSIAVILLFALVAQIYASHELDAYLTEDLEDDSDRHPYVQCKIDLYDCIRKGNQSKRECIKTYFNCMKQLIPTVPPVVQCKIDLIDCIRLKNNKSKSECLKDYKSCISVLIPTVPPFVIACKDELKSCVSGASGILAKAACFKDFGKCLISKGPSPTAMDAGEFVLNAMEDEGPAPTRHPYLQCKFDLYKCIKEGQQGKSQCLKTYKTCMAQLIPTAPPFLINCRNDLKTCYVNASGWKAKAQCFVDFAKCVKNKGSA